MIKKLAYRLGHNTTGLDLCFITCRMSRVMWKTKANRWVLYWNRKNPRSKHWLSFEVHPNPKYVKLERIEPRNGATMSWRTVNPPGAKEKVYF